MIARFRLLVPVTLVVLALVVGCASSTPQVHTAQLTPTEIVDGPGSDSQRAEFNAQNNQIYNTEHGSGSDFPAVVSGTNQDIP